jgi:competence protein ComEC
VALGALIAGLLLSGARAWVGPAGVLAAVVMTATTRRALPALVAAALLLAGCWIGNQRQEAIDRSQLRGTVGNPVAVRGYVIRRERPSAGADRLRLRVTSAALVGSPQRSVDDLVQVRLGEGAPLGPLAIGDEVRVEGWLAAPSNPPREDFDYAGYLRRAGVHAVLRARSISATGRRRGGLAGVVDSIRRRAERGVGMALDPGQAALARGMVLGEDERVPLDVVDDFKASGLAHLLA